LEVQGDTEVEFVVPYTGQTFCNSKSDNVNWPQMQVYAAILSWSQPDDTIGNAIYLNTYIAAAPDFRVGGPIDTKYVCQCNPREDFTQEFQPFHSSMTGYSQEGFIWGEDIRTLRDIVHKPIPRVAATNATIDPITTSRTAGVTLHGLDMIAMFYRFWRGSVKVKIMNAKADTTYRSLIMRYPATSGGVQNYSQGIGVNNPNMNSYEAEIPYYQPNLFDMTGSTPFYKRNIMTNATTSGFICIGAGDDFSLHWLCPPPTGGYVNMGPTDTFGYIGLSQFYK